MEQKPNRPDCVLGHALVREKFQRCRAQEAGKILRLVYLKKPDAKLEKGLRGFRAIALLSRRSTVSTCRPC